MSVNLISKEKGTNHMEPFLIFLVLILVGFVIRYVGKVIAKYLIHIDPALKAHRERLRSHLPKILMKDNSDLSKNDMQDIYFLESEIELYVHNICHHLAKYMDTDKEKIDTIIPDEKILKDILMNTSIIMGSDGIRSIPLNKAYTQSVHEAYDSEGYSKEGKIVFLWYRMYQWDSQIHVNLKEPEKAYDDIYKYIQNDLDKYYAHQNKKSLLIPLYKLMYVHEPKKN